jgi:VWFA-related protein
MSLPAHLGRVILVSLPLAASSFAQQTPAPAKPADKNIHLEVIVTPKSGAADPGLVQQDFTVLNNGAPQTISSFKAFTRREAPPEVVVVIDAVNAPYRVVSFEHDQFKKFLLAEGGHLTFPIAIGVLTDAGIQMLGEFSSDGNALSAQLDSNNSGLRTFRNAAGLQAAAERWTISLNGMRRLVAAEALRPGRKVLIWISPGWPLFANPSGQLSSKQEEQVFNDIVNPWVNIFRASVTMSTLPVRSPLPNSVPSIRSAPANR